MHFDVLRLHTTKKLDQSVKGAECEHLIWFDSYLHDLIRVISGGCQVEFMSAHNSLRQEVLEQHAGVAVIAVLFCEQKSPSMPHTSTQTAPKRRAVSLLTCVMTKEWPESHHRIRYCKYPNMENKNNTKLGWNNRTTVYSGCYWWQTH